MSTPDDNNRRTATLSTIVDEAIVLHEQGRHMAAYSLLLSNGIDIATIHRVINDPDHRRAYINDVVSGF